MKYNDILSWKKIIITSLFFSAILVIANINNQHSDAVFFKNLYNDIKNYSFYDLFPNLFNIENNFYYNSGESFLKLIFWTFSNLSIPEKLFNFFLFFYFNCCFFLIGKIKKINFLLCFLIFLSSFYFWNILLSSIKNVLAINFFFTSVIFYLKERKYLCILFYAFTILTASGYIILYFLFLLFNLHIVNLFLKKNALLIIILVLTPIVFSSDIIIGRFKGYNVISKPYYNEKPSKPYYNEKPGINFLDTKKFINKQFIITIYDHTYFSKTFGIELINQSILLKYSLISSIKIIIFLLLIFFVTKRNKYFLLLFFFTFLIAGLISFEKINLFLYIILITNFFIDYTKIKKYNFCQLAAFFIFGLYFFFKQIQLIHNMYFYNVPFQY